MKPHEGNAGQLLFPGSARLNLGHNVGRTHPILGWVSVGVGSAVDAVWGVEVVFGVFSTAFDVEVDVVRAEEGFREAIFLVCIGWN